MPCAPSILTCLCFLLLAESQWEQLQPSGERPPCLQEHSAVAYKENIYVFGGEVGFSAGTETPLWVYQVKVGCSVGVSSCQVKRNFAARAVLLYNICLLLTFMSSVRQVQNAKCVIHLYILIISFTYLMFEAWWY